MKPKKYDMEKLEDTKRWFREMEWYLETSNFVHQGTDFEGRKYALDGFYQLKKELCLENSRIYTIMKKGEELEDEA